MNIHISSGNIKLGKIPNISLPPILTCEKNIPCSKEGCYALKIYKLRPIVRNAWDENYKFYINNSNEYFKKISLYIKSKRKTPERFRWHVSGDIIDNDYLDGIKEVCFENKETNFLIFTKKKLDYNLIPNNLTIRFSNWPNYYNDSNLSLSSWVKCYGSE